MTGTVHQFPRSVEVERSGRSLLDQGYQQLFRASLEQRLLIEARSHQRAGADVHLLLTNGRLLRVDEKVRSVDVGDGDVALEIEHRSEDDEVQPGWLLKPQACDFVAFAWLSTGRVWLLPFLGLQLAWTRKWERQSRAGELRYVHAHNEGQGGRRYVTLSVIVPAADVRLAVGASLLTWVRRSQ